MSNVYQAPTQLPGSVGVLPNQRFAVFGDNLAAVTTAGYLNSVVVNAQPLSNGDVIQAFYAYNPQTCAGTFGIFTVSIGVNGDITLSIAGSDSEVVLPVAVDGFAVYADTAGKIKALVKANGTVVANAVTANGTAGKLTTPVLSGVAPTPVIITWTNSFITESSIVQLTINGGTNSGVDIVLKAVPSAGSCIVTLTNLISSFDGTLVIGYTVI